MKAAANPSVRPSIGADYSTVESVSRLLIETAQEIEGMTEGMALARQIKEFAGDRRKRALCLPMREFIVAGDTATAAETKARASAIYGEELDAQARQLTDAERTILAYEAAMVRWKSAQSLLSSLKAIAQI